MKELETGEPM